ncbi:methyltransferase [Streptoalloteichus hindustanus]|uniref:O-methyltransferase n=1 Tax=Streptoalloteichus hindustanus TaxID=2017 RepID=A0A1M4Y7M7_STRHI|nr:methyltransferase [Streptoalloteichus hindustanus]SHF01715.1 O-methyltransferase [Streptoalloteichus hindustanus]
MTTTALCPTIPVDRPDALRQLRAFYVDVLGFTATTQSESVLRLASPVDPRLRLDFQRVDGAGAERKGFQLTVEVLDLDRAHAEVVRQGMRLARPLVTEGVRRSFVVVDPAGLLVEVVAEDAARVFGGAPALRRLTDLVTPAAVRAVVRLGVVELAAGGPTRLADLAERSGADAGALERLLRHLVGCGVFAEPSPRVFALTDVGRLLRDEHRGSRMDWIDPEGISSRMDQALLAMTHSIRTGEAVYPLLFGRSFWKDLATEPDLGDGFNAVMGASTSVVAPRLAACHDWSQVGQVVDVGGGDGTLLIELLRAHPHLLGTLVDLPHTASAARANLVRAGVADRCVVVPGSFFDPLPSGADVYVLSNILHDWDDLEAERILRRCAEAAGRRGRVLVSGLPLDAPVERELTTRLDLMVLALFAGRLRSAEDLVRLAATVGLAPASTQVVAGVCLLTEFVTESVPTASA